ncbi:hypothetical protein DX873_03620 [Flagellimonas nanhaiensis]|uniref:Heavy metal binding domain-containing protein n=1 Tax=Flagellimonas nanhaiensis TaxID=2292706 RepID=A0A371JTY6_9FLAO|nr:hypothetical protein DX873_03620 [Allomuricauda nanhaiensis]
MPLFAILFVAMVSCKEQKKEATDELAKVEYQCPMDCEDGKVYESEGTCPICKMDLAAVGHTKECQCGKDGECKCEKGKCNCEKCKEHKKGHASKCNCKADGECKCEKGKCNCEECKAHKGECLCKSDGDCKCEEGKCKCNGCPVHS